MMRVQFVGVGEAFDDVLPNNSQILEWDGCRLLLDCGYAVPQALWKVHPDPESIDAVYISHRHADHYFGLPSYLVRLAEDGRKRDLTVLCPEGMQNVILEMIEYAYQGILPKLGFGIVFQEVTTDHPCEFQGAILQFAVTSHPVKNFAIAVIVKGKKYAYSGDGNYNDHTRRLYRHCSLLVHEAYWLNENRHGHANVMDVLKMASEQQVAVLALTHIQREIRRKQRHEIDNLIRSAGLEVLIPEPGDVYEIR